MGVRSCPVMDRFTGLSVCLGMADVGWFLQDRPLSRDVNVLVLRVLGQIRCGRLRGSLLRLTQTLAEQQEQAFREFGVLV